MSLVNGKWYALQVVRDSEFIAKAALEYRNYSTYLPTISHRKKWSDREKIVEKPMFQGYLFCQFDTSIRHRMIEPQSVLRIVGYGGSPVPIDETELASIRAVAESGSAVEPCDFPCSGQRVRITQGSLKGVEGLFVRQKNRDRIIVQISLLQRSVSADVKFAAVVQM